MNSLIRCPHWKITQVFISGLRIQIRSFGRNCIWKNYRIRFEHPDSIYHCNITFLSIFVDPNYHKISTSLLNSLNIVKKMLRASLWGWIRIQSCFARIASGSGFSCRSDLDPVFLSKCLLSFLDPSKIYTMKTKVMKIEVYITII